MEHKTTDSEYYGKSAKILHMIKYVILLMLLAVVAFGFVMYKKELTIDNFRYIMRYVDIDLGKNYGENAKIEFIRDDTATFGYISGDIAHLSQNGFAAYDFGGSELYSQKNKYLNPRMVTAGKYVLCYDVSGTELAIFNSYSNIYAENFEYGITGADLRRDGCFAVVTSGEHLKSRVVVFEEKGEFEYKSDNKSVVGISLPEEIHAVDLIALEASEGDFVFTLLRYDTKDKTKLAEKKFVGEFPLKLVSNKDSIFILTDKSMYFLSGNGKLRKSIEHNGNTVESCFDSENYVVPVYYRGVTDEKTAVIYDMSGKELDSTVYKENVVSFSERDGRLYVLEKGMLHMYHDDGNSLKKTATKKVDKEANDVFAADADKYVITAPTWAQECRD